MQESEHGTDDEDGEKKRKPKKKAKKKSNKSKKPKGLRASETESLYRPGDYSAARKDFIDKARGGGMTYREGQQAWAESEQRRKLLAGMSEAELKRRRFL